MHVGKAYVANVDIENFFPSIGFKAIAELLRRNGFGPQVAEAVARLTSLGNGLPQGAPTSPTLSNAFLFQFDDRIARYCAINNIVYTRYADDITMSADEKKVLLAGIDEVRLRLAENGLLLNNRKTRVASRGGQQNVTGVVVNEKAQPPRKFRRRVRAMLHQASHNLESAKHRLHELQGYVSYLRSFPTLRDSHHVQRYLASITKISER